MSNLQTLNPRDSYECSQMQRINLHRTLWDFWFCLKTNKQINKLEHIILEVNFVDGGTIS